MPLNDWNFYSSTMIDLVDSLERDLLNSKKQIIVTANSLMVREGYRDSDFKEIISKANLTVPDGIGVVKALKLLNKPVSERITGIDLMKELLSIANKNKLKIFLLGAKPEVITKTAAAIVSEYPQIKLSGYQHGYFTSDEKMIDCIASHEPDIVFVALGSPLQEKWIAENSGKCKKGLFIGVGGAFDVFAGERKRAPEIFIKLNLEWLYRIAFKKDKSILLYNLFVYMILVGKEFLYVKRRNKKKSLQA